VNQDPSTTADTSKEAIPSLDEIYDLLSAGKRVGIKDKQGEVHVLATIPDNIHDYNWQTPQWSWGVLERLFQDCEQAKVKFQMEDYVDEVDGKTKKRVKRDDKGLHAGLGSGWWFEGMEYHISGGSIY
jgi:hypothetical protein